MQSEKLILADVIVVTATIVSFEMVEKPRREVELAS